MILLSFLFFIFAIFTMKYKEKNKGRIFFDASLFFIFGLLSIVYFVASYFTGHGINDTILATLNLGLGEAGFGEYALLILAALASFVVLFVTAFFYYNHLNSVVMTKPQRIKAFIHNGFLILAFAAHPTLLDLKNLYETLTLEQANDFYEYYKSPKNLGSTANAKNIIYIYAESLERTYFDSTLFPNLVPNLSELVKNEHGVEFTNIVQTSGSNYTIAGTTSTQCGIPLYTTSDGNSMDGVGEDKFYPKAVCIGDVLKKENYYLSMMQGSSIKFSGIGKFYKTHGFDTAAGKEELQSKLQDKKYLNGWGLYDDSLLDMAYSEFESLSSTKEKFALFLHTIDTHHPNGQLSKACSKDLYMDGSNDILNTVKCSDTLISQFIKKVKSSKYGNNTVIVITSDHLAMRNTASKQLEKSENRRNLFVIFDSNSTEYQSIDKVGTPFDVASTVLSFLGVNTDLGLGRNLRKNSSIYSLFADYDKRLNQWRNDILSFWEFPKMADTLNINLKKMTVTLGENSYKFPILFRVLENNVEPYFETSYTWKLYTQVQAFNQNDRYLWVDECNLMNYVYDTNISHKYCVTEAIVGGSYRVKGVDKIKEYKIEDLSDNASQNSSPFATIMSHIDMLKNNGLKYSAKLEDGMMFKKSGYPSFLDNIEGVSYPDKLGRWTDAEMNPSAIFTFAKPLPIKFKLELVCGAYGENVGGVVKVKVGNQLKEFIPNHKSPRKYTLSFDNIDSVANSNTIEIIPPKPFILAEELEGGDDRQLGLHLVSLKVINLDGKKE
ncbi:MAG: phosphatidylglycerol--membrane-oligosaccharide glycerophosphotransferase [Sulfurimonas sp.]